jgi:hypothetical protein
MNDTSSPSAVMLTVDPLRAVTVEEVLRLRIEPAAA